MGEVNSDSVAAEPEAGTTEEQTPAEGTVDGNHTCPDCGMSFDRRYTLIMHTLKHEKARGFKCSVSICQYNVFNCKCCGKALTMLLVFHGVCSCVTRSSITRPHSAPTWPDTSSRAANGLLSANPRQSRAPTARWTVIWRTNSCRSPRENLCATSAVRLCQNYTLWGSTCWTTPGCGLTLARCAARRSPTNTTWTCTGRCTASTSSSSVSTVRSSSWASGAWKNTPASIQVSCSSWVYRLCFELFVFCSCTPGASLGTVFPRGCLPGWWF